MRFPARELVDIAEDALDVARGRMLLLGLDAADPFSPPACAPGNAVPELDPGMASERGGASWLVGPARDVTIQSVLSSPASAIRRLGPEEVEAVHAATLLGLVGSAPDAVAVGELGPEDVRDTPASPDPDCSPRSILACPPAPPPTPTSGRKGITSGGSVMYLLLG